MEDVQQKIEMSTSSKIRLWISIIVLLASVILWVIGLSMVHWETMSPAERGEFTGKEIVAFIKFLVPLGIVTWLVKGKIEKLFTFSMLFAVITAIAAYNFVSARHAAQQKTMESDKIYADNMGSLVQFIKGGAVGDLPQFKLTGQQDLDTIFQTTGNFYREYLEEYHNAEAKIKSLQEMDVFEDSVLTNKSMLESEIQKRISSEKIIDSFSASALSSVANFKSTCASLNISDAFKTNFLNGVDKSSQQFKPMFASWDDIQKSEQALLQFLDDNYGYYELKDKNIFFENDAAGQKYKELVKNIEDAHAKAEEFQKRGLATAEAAAKLQ